MNSFCANNELDQLLEDALQHMSNMVITQQHNQESMLLNNDRAQQSNPNMKNKKKRLYKKKKNLNKEEVKELFEHINVLNPVKNQLPVSFMPCPRINEHGKIIDDLLKCYFYGKNVGCVNPCCLPNDFKKNKINTLLKQHASQVKQSFTQQSALFLKEKTYLQEQSDNFLTEFQQQQMFFVHQIKQGITVNPEDVISLAEVPDDATLEHIHLEFDDNDAVMYRDVYKTIFKLCLAKYIEIIDNQFVKEYNQYSTNN